MNTLSHKLLPLLLLLGLGFQACQNSPCNCEEEFKKLNSQSVLDGQKRQGNETNQEASLKQALATQLQSSFSKLNLLEIRQVQNIKLEEIAKLIEKQVVPEQTTAEDAALVNSLFALAFQAENTREKLQLQLFLSEQSLSEGYLILGFDSPEEQTVKIQLYDQENFSLLANNLISLNKGSNYRSLDLQNLENNNYILRISNPQTQAEALRRIEVKR